MAKTKISRRISEACLACQAPATHRHTTYWCDRCDPDALKPLTTEQQLYLMARIIAAWDALPPNSIPIAPIEVTGEEDWETFRARAEAHYEARRVGLLGVGLTVTYNNPDN